MTGDTSQARTVWHVRVESRRAWTRWLRLSWTWSCSCGAFAGWFASEADAFGAAGAHLRERHSPGLTPQAAELSRRQVDRLEQLAGVELQPWQRQVLVVWLEVDRP